MGEKARSGVPDSAEMTPFGADPNCGCNYTLMVALTPLHPMRYLDLACDEHRRVTQEASTSESIRNYVPDNEWRAMR